LKALELQIEALQRPRGEGSDGGKPAAGADSGGCACGRPGCVLGGFFAEGIGKNRVTCAPRGEGVFPFPANYWMWGSVVSRGESCRQTGRVARSRERDRGATGADRAGVSMGRGCIGTVAMSM